MSMNKKLIFWPVLGSTVGNVMHAPQSHLAPRVYVPRKANLLRRADFTHEAY